MSNRPLVLDPHVYRSSFINSLLSEIRKLAFLRSFWVQSAAMIGLYALIMWPVGASQNEYGDFQLDAQVVTTGISFLIIFAFALGTSAVTNEYSSNTMRTTTLSDPSRLRSYTAKHVAVFLMIGAVNLVLTVVSTLVYTVFADGSWDFGNGNVRALVMFWLVLTTATTMATSLGYILRSTAGTITLSMVLVYVSNAVTLINIEWIRETLVDYLPLQLIQSSTSTDFGASFYDVSWSTSGIVWILYALAFWLLGLLRYTRSDV
ncbi:MAG: hypothetical protein ACTHW1_03960 [Ancrocorticia sp.]|uniref:hypothetical protein n=1 Tax=Ancrocorticia sp. TaxID=2593684 RepID=UPI003F938E79